MFYHANFNVTEKHNQWHIYVFRYQMLNMDKRKRMSHSCLIQKTKCPRVKSHRPLYKENAILSDEHVKYGWLG